MFNIMEYIDDFKQANLTYSSSEKIKLFSHDNIAAFVQSWYFSGDSRRPRCGFDEMDFACVILETLPYSSP